MRTPLIVDGYNVLYENPHLSRLARRSFEEGREMLITYLGAKAQAYEITVVFDGWRSGSMVETTEWARGVRVVYSRLGERADEVIKRLIDRSPAQTVVVSNDIEIRTHALRAGCQVARPDKLTPNATRTPGRDDDDPSGRAGQARGTKKGPAQRPKRRRGPPEWQF